MGGPDVATFLRESNDLRLKPAITFPVDTLPHKIQVQSHTLPPHALPVNALFAMTIHTLLAVLK